MMIFIVFANPKNLMVLDFISILWFVYENSVKLQRELSHLIASGSCNSTSSAMALVSSRFAIRLPILVRDGAKS